MRVKLQLVLCNDEGEEETVTDVITLNKNNQRIAHLGLTLSEAKQLLSTTQRHLLWQQVDAFLILSSPVGSVDRVDRPGAAVYGSQVVLPGFLRHEP